MRTAKIYKQYFFILLVYIICINIKIVISYKYIFSNFISFKIFSKNIDIVSILGSKIKLFRVLYIFLNSFIIFEIVNYIFKKIENPKQLSKDLSAIVEKGDLILMGNKKIIFKEKGLFQNILITGSIGSGKTSCAISPLLFQLISGITAGVIIDIKGNYKKEVLKMCENVKVVEISLESKNKYNPLNRKDISCQEIASRLKSVLELMSGKSNSDPYWLDKARGYISDIMTILKYSDESLNFLNIHLLVTSEELLREKMAKVKNKILKNKFNDKELFEINSSVNNLNNEFLKLDDRTKNIIKSEITRITDPFIKEEYIYEKFCSDCEEIDFLNSIVVVSLDIGKNEELTKLIATYVKIDFQKRVLSQKEEKVKTFFVCDEYQMIANEKDAYFFSVSREFKCINIIAMQSYTSLINTLKNENAAKMIIHNFVNKIWFRNDDTFTIKETISIIGKELKKQKAVNYGENSTKTRFSFFRYRFNDINSGLSKGYYISDKYEYKFSEEYFTTALNTFEAVILRGDGESVTLEEKIKLKRWDEYENEFYK